MEGFEERFTDIVHYILQITHDIWEGKGVGLIYDYYTHNCRVHTAEGLVYGREAMIRGTLAALAAFPDRRLYGDDVIWCGDDQKGFYTSHRITHVGRNTGYSEFGPPTGRQVRYMAIADCVVRQNRIMEEWLVRDNLTLVRQLGFDPGELAREMAERNSGVSAFQPVGEVERVQGQDTPARLPPPPPEFDITDFIPRVLHQIWNWRLLNTIDESHASTYTGHLPGGRELYGRGDLKAHILAMLAAFPDAALSIDHFCALAGGSDRYRTATRWTLSGTHLGPGVYGPPTGRRVSILGISHHLVADGCIQQEWTVYDEFALLKRLYRPEGPVGQGTSARPSAP
ncbi:MAG: hypothetical protein D6775_16215 [Caldilineae bacterium]|nr:MAG: hypothetical protein D6775_16215 [Caldilineae bacterium]